MTPEIAAIAARAHNHRWSAEDQTWSCEADIKTLVEHIEKMEKSLEKLRHFYNVCAKCEAKLLPPNSPPRCEDCHLTDEQNIDWEHKAFDLNGGFL